MDNPKRGAPLINLPRTTQFPAAKGTFGLKWKSCTATLKIDGLFPSNVLGQGLHGERPVSPQ
jgi:hypothetical protein